MRIGITFCPDQTVWYSGANQTTLLLAELFSTLQYEVILLNRTHSETVWCSDYPKPDIPVSSLSKTSGLDWLIDIDGLVRAEDRKKAATKSIVFLRTFLQFAEMDASVYSEYPYASRTFQGVHEVWCWDVLNPANTIPSIQTLFPCPLRTIPFIWSPSIISHFSKKYATYDKDNSWTVHVSEKNSDNTSSSILPLVAIREMTKVHHLSATYHVHNMDKIKENKFLKVNIFDNIELETLPITIAPKEPWYDWIEQATNSAVISHVRFTLLRPSLLHLLWLGIPLVHNSPVLSELHPQLRAMYYKGNDIREMAEIMSSLLEKPSSWYDAQQDIRDAMMKRFSIESNLSQWRTVCDDVFSQINNNCTLQNDIIPEANTSTNIIIAFSDMWAGFNYHSNFIMDALRHEAPSASIKGMEYDSNIVPSLVIFGPYSHHWKQIPSSIPKVFFSGENWAVPQDSSIALSITSSLTEDANHLRIPTWITFIDWFSTSTELPHGCTDNPIRIPLHFAMNSHPVPFSKRSKFCAFVVSNPTCSLRNEAFQKVNAYKPVNSGGALYNNIGGQLELKYAGGGCGDLSKYAFFSEHQFTISFENSQSPGYLTEKLLHSKMAGCVPLYWGDSQSNDFVPNSFINLSAITTADSIVDIIKKLEARPDMCESIAATPILDEERKRNALRMISKMGQKLLSLVASNQNTPIPNAPIPNAPLHLDRIDNTFLVNLDSRPDRLESLFATEPRLKDMIVRIPAVHGKTLKMNPTIYKLCKDNPFQWKKSVIGCYLSHLTIWTRILQEPGNLFLVLEDDVRFQPGWVEQWNKAAASMPQDAELIYWGGVLPPNKHVLPMVSESVSEYWSRIRPNTFFSREPSSLFHFCTYSYLITKTGAQKLLQYIQTLHGMPFSGCDHLLNHAGLCTYLTNPLLASCFQDEDPVYIHAQFDKIQEQDNFDSDIRNDKDCFSVQDLLPFYHETVPDKVVGTDIVKESTIQESVQEKTISLYYLTDKPHEPFQLYEGAWIEDMFQCRVQCISLVGTDVSTIPNGSWFLVQRPHVSTWTALFQQFQNIGLSFKVLHLSDEFCMDDLSFYSLPSCRAVIRNYVRNDTPKLPHILTIPLGYHHKYKASQKSMKDRKWLWSFHGTDWFDRSTQLYAFQSFVPHSCHLQPDWNHSSGTKQADYLSILGNSKFCPILKGNHSETFRFYEALEAGVLPLFGNTISPEFITWVKEHIDLSAIYDWTVPENMTQSIEISENAQKEMIKQWAAWKEKIKAACCVLVSQ